MAIETELETLKRHLKDFKQFEYEERMLRQKYEKALEFIVNVDGWFIGKDMEFDNEIALDLIDKTARKALK